MSSTYLDFNRALIQDLRSHHGKATSGPFVGRELVILTTKGAKTGAVHESPIVYSRDGDRYVVIASKGGAPTNPSWYHNLKAHPETTIEVGGDTVAVTATEATGEERDRLFSAQAEKSPQFGEYQDKTRRVIPVVILSPTG